VPNNNYNYLFVHLETEFHNYKITKQIILKQETKFIHAGAEPDPATGAIMTPIYQTSTFVQESPGVHKGYEYARTKNPTRTALETALAAVENGKKWQLQRSQSPPGDLYDTG